MRERLLNQLAGLLYLLLKHFDHSHICLILFDDLQELLELFLDPSVFRHTQHR